MDDITFDFERTLEAQQPDSTASGQGDVANIGPGGRPEPKPRNYRQTVCTYWLRGLCMKGDTCGFLHQFEPSRMPVCRNLLKFGTCKEPDCPYKHTTDEIKECNMYKLGFCVYGPACRFKHTRQAGPPPDFSTLEAAKPKEFRNINVVANQANDNILPAEMRTRRPFRLGTAPGGQQQQQLPALAAPPGHYGQQRPQQQGGYGGQQQLLPGGVRPPPYVDQSLLQAVGQRDLRYGF